MQTLSARSIKHCAVISHPAVLSAVLAVAVAALYGPFLGNPLVFDDKQFFAEGSVLSDALVPSPLGSRWVSYTTLAWTKELFGTGIVPFRMGNLALHAATAVLLFVFLRRLFQLALPTAADTRLSRSPAWLAFLAGALFALHPIAVYAAAYLVQRSILMAGLFCLLMWFAYMEGLARQKQGLLLVSTLFYYLAVFSKELSVMAPAAAVCLTLLLRKPSLTLAKTIGPAFLLYAAIALLTILNALHIIGTTYEPLVKEALTDVPERALLLSAINQSFLFFKYLLLWIIPYPGWMSVDIRVPFPEGAFTLPQALGAAAFLSTITWAVFLCTRGRRAETRLAGFALLMPALMFMTEFSTVRIQEPFVLYRSYLWFGLLFAALPALSYYVNAKKMAVGLAAVCITLIPASWNRLTTFSDPVLLWSDAVALVESDPEVSPDPRLFGVDRIYYNRGNALLMKRRSKEAIEDYTKAIELNPTNQGAYNNRGYVYYQDGRYVEAIRDFRKAIDINPRSRRPHFSLGMAYRASGQERLAEEHLRRACEKGFQPACIEFRKTTRPTATSRNP